MTKKQLSAFNSDELSRIIKQLGTKPRIFNSEAQFQFELAWKIKEKFNCNVRLEELSRCHNGKKDYTDIILEKDGVKIAIELKYKTAALEIPLQNVLLFEQGAVDLGCYDFLQDVNRVELLTDYDTEGLMASCLKGYAVILTNDDLYWTQSDTKTIYREFRIGGNPSGILKSGEHTWWNKQQVRGMIPSAAKSRSASITLRNNYPYCWKDYCRNLDTTNGTFKYMIIEIERPIKEQNEYLKEKLVNTVTERIGNIYGFRWEKCFDLVMQSSWWDELVEKDYVAQRRLDEIVASICKEIDDDVIF